MAAHSVDVKDLKGFLQDAKAPGRSARNAEVVRHLLAACAPCRENLKKVSSKPQAYDYGAAFARTERALAGVLAQGEPSVTSPEALLAELSPLPAAAQAERVSSERRYARPEFIKHLIDASQATRYQDAAAMLHQADLARLAAEACSVETAGSEARRSDLLAHGWRQYGNALRVLGRLPQADEALATAQRHLEAGTRDPLLRARFCMQKASLLMAQRRFKEAIGHSEEAVQIYRELEDDRSLGGALVQQALAFLYGGEPEEAVYILNQAIPLIGPDGDPHLLLAACHNLVLCYIELGRPEQALSIYSETRDLYRRFQDPLIQLRAAWQEGQILRDLGHLRPAEAALLRARQGFIERELLYEAALISLDLASVYVKLHAEAELKQTVTETVPIFRALRVDREVLASLLQLRQLAEQSRQALALLRVLSSRIEQLPARTSLP